MRLSENRALVERTRESLESFGYQVISFLGEGSFGIVHKIIDSNGNTYAVKTTRPNSQSRNLNSDRDRKVTIQDETIVSQALADKYRASPADYVGVVRIYSVIKDGPLHHFVMEFLNGSNLGEYIKNYSPMGASVPESRIITYEVLRGLAFLHRMGILHRDVKPENVFIEHDDAGNIRGVKLIDIGFSRLFGPVNVGEIGSALTKSGVGSPLYLCPEVERKNGYGAECDLWGAGNVLYYAATGRTLVKNSFYVDNDRRRTYMDEKKDIWDGRKDSVFDCVESEDVKFMLRTLLTKMGMYKYGSAAGLLEDFWFASY